MDAQPLSTAAIQDGFHHQVRQYGQELLSFVSAELRGAPSSGLSITLETIEWPESQVNWVWFVGSADPATEQAVLRFFQSDVGKSALSADVVEFKLASAPLRLPGTGRTEDPDPVRPAGLAAAAAPLQDGQEQEVTIMSESASVPHSHVCIPAPTGGWLQVPPHMHLSPALVVKPKDQQALADPEYLRGWVVDRESLTTHGHVAAIVGARGYLVVPLTSQAT